MVTRKIVEGTVNESLFCLITRKPMDTRNCLGMKYALLECWWRGIYMMSRERVVMLLTLLLMVEEKVFSETGSDNPYMYG